MSDFKKITEYLNISTTRGAAKLGFIFGTKSDFPAKLAYKLFEDRLVEFIVTTGGINKYTGLNESDNHRKMLIDFGVPSDKIISENKSTNTDENVRFSLKILGNFINVGDITAIHIIAKWYHARRGIMTLKTIFPSGIKYYITSYEPKCVLKKSWWKNKSGKKCVFHEWNAIPGLLKKIG